MMSNSVSFMTGLDKSVKRLDVKMQRRVRILIEEGMRRMLRRTPVHTGKAVMSYVASAGTPSGGSSQGFTPVEATNILPLGSESLRGQAESVALATLLAMDYSDPYKTFYVSNNADNIAGLEAGELPAAPYTPRSPQGMFRVTLQELSALLDSGKF